MIMMEDAYIDHEADDLITLPLERPEMEGAVCAELFCMEFWLLRRPRSRIFPE